MNGTEQIVTGRRQRNVMLKVPENENSALQGKQFPCPVCEADLPILLSVKQKPYCTCNDCGIQLFFRGRAGIDRLKDTLQSDKFSTTSQVTVLYTRLEKLRAEKSAL